MGPVTPTKIASYGLLLAGFAVFLGKSIAPALRGDFGTGIGLILIGLSCLVDLLPGGSELTDEQTVMIRHIGIPYRPGAEKWLNFVCGIALLAAGAMFLA